MPPYAQVLYSLDVMDIVTIENSMVLVHDDILDSVSIAYESHIAIVILVLHL